MYTLSAVRPGDLVMEPWKKLALCVSMQPVVQVPEDRVGSEPMWRVANEDELASTTAHMCTYLVAVSTGENRLVSFIESSGASGYFMVRRGTRGTAAQRGTGG